MTLLDRGNATASPILDYAGPASRGALRLPARSDIAVTRDGGRLVITETLAGQANALLALVFASLTMVPMVATERQLVEKWRRHVDQILLIGALMATEVAVGGLVVNNTWRKTMLRVTPDGMTLTFSAPLSGATRFEFRSEMVAEVSVIDSAPAGTSVTIPELEVRLWSAPAVRLFPGHRRTQLRHLVSLIQEVQPPAPPTPTVTFKARAAGEA
jgi:hypothetical protein